MEILSRFERRAIEEIKLDNTIDADDYESVGKLKHILKIRQAIGLAFRKDWPKRSYSLDDILNTGKLFD
jgi:hypothetical protein